MTFLKLRWFFIFSGLLAAGLAALYFYPHSSDVPAVTTIPVRIGDIESSVQATGRIDAAERVSVGTQVSGQIKVLRVQPGQRVSQGQLIAEIDDQPRQAELSTALAHLDELTASRRGAEATLKQSQQRFQREKRLLSADADSREDYESAAAALASSQATLEGLKAQFVQAQIAVDEKRLELGYTRITSPLDGVVIAVAAREGQTVNASQNTPTIALLARMDNMVVRAKISETDVSHIHPGLPAVFTVFADPARRYQAKLRSVALAPDAVMNSENNGTAPSGAVYYSALLDVPNVDGSLRIDMTAQVSIVLARASGVLLVPVMAVRQEGARSVVQVRQADGVLVNREVTTGLSDENDIQITSGLVEGEQVVLAQALPGAGAGDDAEAQP